MASKDIKEIAKVTLPASVPGAIAEVDVTVTGIAPADIVILSFEGTRPVTPVGESFNVYVSSIGTNILKIKANRPQTPECKVNVLVIEA